MQRVISAALLYLAFCLPVSAQTVCNDPSGFLKTFGSITLGDFLALGPDCQHVSDGGVPNQAGAIPTQSNVTITIAAPGVVTWTNHNLGIGATVIFPNNGDTLPTGLSLVPANSNPVPVYVIPVDANHFQLATTPANAINGLAITTTGSQSGSHIAVANAVACAGCVGEVIWNVVTLPGVALSGSVVDKVWNSITLTPGIWEVRAQSGILGGSVAATAMFSDYGFGLTNVGSAPDNGRLTGLNVNSNNTNDWIFTNLSTVVFNTTTQSMNAVLNATYAGTPPGAYGTISATRIH